MNTQQRTYAISRVNQIEKEKLEALREKLHRPAIRITPAQRFELVRDKKVKLHADVTEISDYLDVVRCFDFSKFERSAGPDPDKYEPAAAVIKNEAGKVRDRIMLGDAAEALALLETFAA